MVGPARAERPHRDRDALRHHGSDAALTIAGDRESSTAPYTTAVAAGAPNSLSLVASPNNGSGEQDLFAATTAADGSTWAAGWFLNGSE